MEQIYFDGVTSGHVIAAQGPATPAELALSRTQSQGEVIDFIGTRSNLGESRWMTAPHMPAKITSQRQSKSRAGISRAVAPRCPPYPTG